MAWLFVSPGSKNRYDYYHSFMFVMRCWTRIIIFVLLACFFLCFPIGKVCFISTYRISFVDMGHPAIDMLIKNFAQFVAEDVELANRGLSHTAGRKKGQGEVLCLFHLFIANSILG